MKLSVALLIVLNAFRVHAGIEDGLVAHWTFDNDHSVVYDQSGFNLHGRSVSVTYEQGIIGQAARFDQVADRIIISDSLTKLPGRIANLGIGSISIWFKFLNVSGQVLPIFYYGESSATAPHNSLIIEIGHNETLQNRRIYFTIVNARYCFDSKANLEENKWYHFVAAVGNNGNTGYLNGEELTGRNYNLGSDKTYTNFFSSVPVNKLCTIGYGRYGLNNNFLNFRGLIDDLRIYDGPLPEEEVKELYSMGAAVQGSDPTYGNVKYGPYDRNVLDFWKASADSPTPLVIFIHGGGFTSGDKMQARSGSNLNYMKRCLENSVSFAAINYRFRQTTRLDTILLDIARAVKFLRYKSAEWNIDKGKIASYGGSAGGGATIWLAFGNDLADPGNADPVLRESTRLTVAGHLNSQATYDFLLWDKIVGLPVNWYETLKLTDDLALYHIPDRTWYEKPEIVALRKKLDMVAMIDAGDPPVYFQSPNPNIPPASSGAVIHHPKHPIFLKARYDSLGIDNAIVLYETPAAERTDMLDFFFKYLLKTTGVNEYKTGKPLIVRPNPASDFIEVGYPPSASMEFTARGRVLKIYNIQGECLYSSKTDPYGRDQRIGLEKWKEGLYFLKTGEATVKFSIIR